MTSTPSTLARSAALLSALEAGEVLMQTYGDGGTGWRWWLAPSGDPVTAWSVTVLRNRRLLTRDDDASDDRLAVWRLT